MATTRTPWVVISYYCYDMIFLGESRKGGVYRKDLHSETVLQQALVIAS